MTFMKQHFRVFLSQHLSSFLSFLLLFLPSFLFLPPPILSSPCFYYTVFMHTEDFLFTSLCSTETVKIDFFALCFVLHSFTSFLPPLLSAARGDKQVDAAAFRRLDREQSFCDEHCGEPDEYLKGKCCCCI